MDVVRIILNKENKESLKFFDGFQKFIFTHDKGFFNLIRRNTDEEEWKYYNFTKDELNNSSPTVKEDENNLQRAIRYFEEDEFENCGNELRRGAEEILSSYLDPEMKRVGKDFESLTKKLDKAYKILINRRLMKFKNRFLIDLDIEKIQKINGDIDSDPELNDQEKALLNQHKRRLFEFLIEFNKEGDRIVKHIIGVKEVLDRVMNPASHSSENPLYRAELKDAIDKVKELKEHLNP